MHNAIEWLDDESDLDDLVLFLDFDGTLAPIVERPGDAQPLDGVTELVEAISERIPVAVISGRGLEDVAARLGADGVVYAGSHGMEIRDRQGMRHESEKLKSLLPEIDALETGLREQFSKHSEIEVERKRFGVAVHFRRAPKLREDVEQILEHLVETHHHFTVGTGKMVRELQPNLGLNKGTALRFIWNVVDEEQRRRPIFIGDDVTDEDAFEMIEDRGIGILVGEHDRPTAARLRLDDPGEVRAFLRRLAKRLGVDVSTLYYQ